MADPEGTGPGEGGWLLPAVLVVLLGVLVATAVLLWQDRDAEASAERPRAADIGAPAGSGGASGASGAGANQDGPGVDVVLAARDAVARVFSLDHRRLEQDLRRARAVLSEELGDELADRTARLRRTVAREQLVLTPALPAEGTATEHLATDSAQVLVVADVTTRTPAGGTDVRRYRTRVGLALGDDGTWVVTALDQVT